MKICKNIISILALFISFSIGPELFADSDFSSPTALFLEENSTKDIKYNLRLDDVKMNCSGLFNKAIEGETEGFVGYHGDSLSYRVFQDIIRTVIEEIVDISIPEDFHFLAVPFHHEQKVNLMPDILSYFTPDHDLSQQIDGQLFPIQPTLYSNYNTLGTCPVGCFYHNIPHTNFQRDHLEKELECMFIWLGIDTAKVSEVFDLALEALDDGKNERGILLQVFDSISCQGAGCYPFVDDCCYPAYPNGYPYQNKSISEYIYGSCGFPPEMRIVVTNEHTLNPTSSLRMKRYDTFKISTLQEHDRVLREYITNLSYDIEKQEEYRAMLLDAWQ